MAKKISAVAAPVADVRKVPLKIAELKGTTALTAIAVAVNEHVGADVTMLNTFATQIKVFGPMTSEQWEAFIKPALLEALSKQPRIKDPANYASRLKSAALALNSGLFPKSFGQTLRDYLDAVREPLKTAVLADGRSIFPVRADGKPKGKGRKPMTAKAKAEAAKAREAAKIAEAAKGSAGVSRDFEGGHDVSRYHALAVSLMGSEKAGKDLLRMLKEHRKELDACIATTLKAADEADASAKAKAAKQAAKPPAPAASAQAILAMANATQPAKANGASA